MHRDRRHLVLAAILVFAAVPAFAQVDTGSEKATERPVEVSPFYSFGSLGSSRIGAAIRIALMPKLSVEVESGYRSAEIDAFSTHASVVYDLPRFGIVTPYVAGGVGLGEYGVTMSAPAGDLVTRERLKFVVNAGGGVRVDVRDRWGIRADVRWFNPIGAQAEHWRVFNGVTLR